MSPYEDRMSWLAEAVNQFRKDGDSKKLAERLETEVKNARASDRIVTTDDEPKDSNVYYSFGAANDYDLEKDVDLQAQVLRNAERQLSGHENSVEKFLENYRKNNRAIERELRESVLRLWKRQEQVRFLERHKGFVVDDGMDGAPKVPRMR